MPPSSGKQAAKTTLLIDADIIAYEFSTRGQRVYNWGDDADDVSVMVDSIDEITPGVAQRIADYVDRLEADDVIVCLTPSPDVNNFRKQLAPYYKGNRKNVAKPLLHGAVRDFMLAKYRCYMRDGLEADDCMGILATHPTLVKGETVIVSRDKDMRTIPGKLYNPAKGRVETITEAEADYMHLFQTLTGDQVDNYPGLPGVGPVKAEAILHAPSGEQYGQWSAWQAVVSAYVARELTEQDALLQARLARILRASDYDFKRKAPILWQPK